ARRRHDRNETMELVIEAYLPADLGPKTLHARVVIVQPNACQPTYQEIEDAARNDFMPGVMTDALPAVDHIQTLVETSQQRADLFRIILQVGVHGQDDVASSRVEPGR